MAQTRRISKKLKGQCMRCKELQNVSCRLGHNPMCYREGRKKCEDYKETKKQKLTE